MPLRTVYWQQTQPELVDFWEFQFQRVGSNEWEWVIQVDPVDDCLECFQAVVELPNTAILVRSRAVGMEGPTGWSNQLPVYSPEPAFTLGAAIGILFILYISGQRKCRKWFW